MDQTPEATIPDRLHFVWIGKTLPWFAQLAMYSALRACPSATVTLWATHEEVARGLAWFAEVERFSVRKLDERALLDAAPAELPREVLARLATAVKTPAARANIARLLVLLRYGGIYLDSDTVTLRDLAPLRTVGGFCGLEHVVWPNDARRRTVSYRMLGGPWRELARQVCGRAPRGELMFERIARHYALAANNAVLGFAAGHPFLVHMLSTAARMAPDEQLRRYRLGTHLLQQALRERGAALAVEQHSPRFFYPLGPEMSRQYFRPRSDVQAALDRVVTPNTYVVHWYASVSELAGYDAARVRAERATSLFAAICARALGAEVAS